MHQLAGSLRLIYFKKKGDITVTITITMDWLVYAYMFLENLLFIYAQELKVRSWRAYYDELMNLDIDCSQLHIIEDNPVPISYEAEIPYHTEIVKAEISELDDRTESLWNELQLELGGLDEEFLEPATNEITFLANDDQENLEDCISIDDLKEESSSEPTGYEQFASAKIADEIEGAQQWIVSVIGMEDEYIHVSDGKRIWLKVGQQVLKIRNHDVLALDVYRSGNKVEVMRLFRLETGIDPEYSIPDEIYHTFSDEKMVI